MIGMNNIPAWVSAGAATLSLIFTVVSWYLSNKSKKAKEKAEAAHQATLDMCAAVQRSAQAAEERVEQVEKSLEQMKQIVTEQQSQSQSQSKIADSLYRPTLELAHVVEDQRPDNYHYMLRNISGNPVTVLEVKNLDAFITPYCDIPDLPATVHPGSPLRFHLPRTGKVESLELRINDSGQEKTLYVEFPIVRAFNI